MWHPCLLLYRFVQCTMDTNADVDGTNDTHIDVILEMIHILMWLIQMSMQIEMIHIAAMEDDLIIFCFPSIAIFIRYLFLLFLTYLPKLGEEKKTRRGKAWFCCLPTDSLFPTVFAAFRKCLFYIWKHLMICVIWMVIKHECMLVYQSDQI